MYIYMYIGFLNRICFFMVQFGESCAEVCCSALQCFVLALPLDVWLWQSEALSLSVFVRVCICICV